MAEPPVPQRPAPIHVAGSAHGRMSSWILVGTVIVAFIAGGLALILHIWWLFWIALAIVLLSVPAGGLIGIMHDTVAWDHAMPPEHQPPQHTAED